MSNTDTIFDKKDHILIRLSKNKKVTDLEDVCARLQAAINMVFTNSKVKVTLSCVNYQMIISVPTIESEEISKEKLAEIADYITNIKVEGSVDVISDALKKEI